LSISF